MMEETKPSTSELHSNLGKLVKRIRSMCGKQLGRGELYVLFDFKDLTYI